MCDKNLNTGRLVARIIQEKSELVSWEDTSFSKLINGIVRMKSDHYELPFPFKPAVVNLT